jgi:hypothetical protein
VLPLAVLKLRLIDTLLPTRKPLALELEDPKN